MGWGKNRIVTTYSRIEHYVKLKKYIKTQRIPVHCSFITGNSYNLYKFPRKMYNGIFPGNFLRRSRVKATS